MDKHFFEMNRLSFARADLSGSNLSFSNARGAMLFEANLSGVNFLGSFLAEANLDFANLSKANLCHVNLRGASLYGANLNGAIYNKKTVWPDGFDPIKEGARLSNDFG